MTIHDRLRHLRKASGLTQERVAQQVGLTRQALSSYEAGRTRPDIETLMKLAEIYGTDLDGVLYGDHQLLKWNRIITRAATVLLVLSLLLPAVGSACLWISNRFFSPMGLTGDALKETFAVHQKWSQAWELADGILLLLSRVGKLLLLFLLSWKKNSIPLKRKAIYTALLCAAPFIVSLPFACTDPVFSAVNYLFTPRHLAIGTFLFFLLHLLIERLLVRKKR